jgi:hypothetical protein
MKRFDLEQAIMSCWNVVEDIDVISEHFQENDEVVNVLMGLSRLYQMKFEKCFNLFEECIREGGITPVRRIRGYEQDAGYPDTFS